MISDDGVTPILMDFGSVVKARIPITNRSEALAHQVILHQVSSWIQLNRSMIRTLQQSKVPWLTVHLSCST